MIAVARTSKTILSKTGESRHPCLIPNSFSFSFLGIMLAVGLGHIWPLLCWGRFLLCWFSGEFYHKRVLNFDESFLCICWHNHTAFIFQFVNMVYHTNWFAYIEESCIPGINPIWSWWMILLMCCWILPDWTLLRIFLPLCASLMLACKFPFVVFFVLVSRWRQPCRMSLGVFLPLKFFGIFWAG